MTVYTFGIELEIVGIGQESAARAIRAAGIEAHAEGYNHSTRPHWKVVTDASVHGRGGSCEVVSPILRTDDLTDMVRVIHALKASGARVNASAGTHVHIGAGDMAASGRALFFANWRALHDGIDLLVARSRRQGGSGYNWCSRYDDRTFDRVRDDLDAGAMALDVGRYYSLNVDPLRRQGTMEVRQHQGSVNAGKLSAWVSLLAAIASASQAGFEAPAIAGVSTDSTAQALAWAQACGGLTDRHANYLTLRAAEFAAQLNTPLV